VFATPTGSWLKERFHSTQETRHSSTYAREKEDSKDRWYGLFLLWPILNTFLDVLTFINKMRKKRVQRRQNSESTSEITDIKDELTTSERDENKADREFKLSNVSSLDHFSTFYSLLFSLSTIIWYVIYLYSDNIRAYLVFLAAVFIIGWTYTTSLVKMWRQFAILIYAVKLIIWRDITRFILIYVCVLLGFSLAFYAMAQAEIAQGSSYDSKIYTIYMTFCLMLGLGPIFDDLTVEHYTHEDVEVLVKIILMVYVSISTVILLNLLIAMMNDTYQEIMRDSIKVVAYDELCTLSFILWVERLAPCIVQTLLCCRSKSLDSEGSSAESERWIIKCSIEERNRQKKENQKKYEKGLASNVAKTKKEVTEIIARLEKLEQDRKRQQADTKSIGNKLDIIMKSLSSISRSGEFEQSLGSGQEPITT
jgi:hypothetical protein